MTVGQRCDQCNKLPRIGDLETMTKSKNLRKVLIENFSSTQMEAYGITKDDFGNYVTTNESISTLVTLDQENLAYFKEFIEQKSQEKRVFVDDSLLYNAINNLTD